MTARRPTRWSEALRRADVTVDDLAARSGRSVWTIEQALSGEHRHPLRWWVDLGARLRLRPRTVEALVRECVGEVWFDEQLYRAVPENETEGGSNVY